MILMMYSEIRHSCFTTLGDFRGLVQDNTHIHILVITGHSNDQKIGINFKIITKMRIHQQHNTCIEVCCDVRL